MLLGRLRGLHLITLGAAIAVSSIAFGAFAQQVVTCPLHSQPTGNASVPLVINFTGTVAIPILSLVGLALIQNAYQHQI